jgi:hypothetical protein
MHKIQKKYYPCPNIHYNTYENIVHVLVSKTFN